MGWAAGADHGDFLRRSHAQARTKMALRHRGHRLCRRGRRSVRFDLAWQPCRCRHVRRERAWCKGQRRNIDARCALPIRSRSRPYRRGRKGPQRIACLSGTPHRARPGAGSPGFAGRSRHRDIGRDAARGKSHRHGRARGHRADAAAARCAGGCRRMHRRDRGVLPDRRRWVGRHCRVHPCDARRDQCHSRPGIVHDRYPLRLRCPPQACGGRHRPPDRNHRQASKAVVADRCHPRQSHRALRALAQTAGGGCHRGRGLSRLRASKRRRP